MVNCAENLPGLSKLPKTRIPPQGGVVGEHSKCTEGGFARTAGALRRENVGMSNRKADEKSAPRKSKVSSAM